MEDVLHVLGIVITIDYVVVRCRSLPQHNTSKHIGVQVHVDIDERVNFGRGQIKSIASSIFGCG